MTALRKAPARATGRNGVLGALSTCRRGSVALAFAIVYPLLLLVYAAGFEMSRACAVSSRLTDMTAELAAVLAKPKMNYIVAQTHYTYQPLLGLTWIPAVPLGARAEFIPRNRATVDYQPQA